MHSYCRYMSLLEFISIDLTHLTMRDSHNPEGDPADSKGFLRTCLPPAITREGVSSICHLGRSFSGLGESHEIIYVKQSYTMLVFALIFAWSLGRL